MKKIQQELGRLIEIQDLNNRFELTNQVEEVLLEVNGVDINLRIKELTDRIEALRTILRNTAKESE